MPEATAKADNPRVAALDTLRGVAVLLVLGAHLPAPKGESGLNFLILAWQKIGWIGVDLFFVLSGFLVSGLLFRSWKEHGRLAAGRFLMRRAWKIYPAFFVMLGIVQLRSYLTSNWLAWPYVLSEALFVQNYGTPIFPHSWSLAVEEHFYLLLPLLLFAVRGTKERPFARLPAVCAVIAFSCLALRIWTAWDGTVPVMKIYQPTHLRVDSLFFGVFIAWLHQFHRAVLASFVQQWRKAIPYAALLLALPPFIWPLGTAWGIHTFGLTGLWLAAGLLLVFKLHTPGQRGVLAWIGTYSYSIYLWHFTARLMCIPLLLAPEQRGGWLELLVYFALSFGCGLLSAWLVEMPFLRLRERLFPAR